MVLSPLRLGFLWTGLLLTVAADPVIKPPKVVVEYGASASAECLTNLTHLGMGWEAPLDPVDMTFDVSTLNWTAETVTEWNISPFCYINVNAVDQRKKNLIVVVYKVPDKVTIGFTNPSESVIEGSKKVLQCKIMNVAPAGNLSVKWYKGQTLVNNSRFTDSTTNPQNKTSNHVIYPSESDNGAEYRCEAQLELGPEGPQPPPRVRSGALMMNVLFKPKFSSNEEIVKQTDDETILDCTARGNPRPTYSWEPPAPSGTSDKAVLKLPPQTVGSYKCTAVNAQGSATKQFTIQPQSRSRTVFWAILGSGLALVVLLIVGYVVNKKMNSNSVV
ncbi:vascular cell adhesion protein 1-like [Salminus brasiliensis]|uniref:vascular cell adhesion protein 1-like n=1 Tax=Salminus brasiliensis TaxID=930266 RepID=UPI003B82FD22